MHLSTKYTGEMANNDFEVCIVARENLFHLRYAIMLIRCILFIIESKCYWVSVHSPLD